MSETPPIDERPVSAPPPSAAAGRGRWPGLVWAIPLAALLIVAFLGLRAFFDRGIDVVLTAKAIGGVKAGDTKVLYQGYEVGHVTKVAVGKEAKTVDLTLRMDHRSIDAMNTSTVFWLIGTKPSISDISSIKAALTGVAIGVAPGFTGEPARHFQALDDAPVIQPGTPGTAYELTSDDLGSVKRGSSVVHGGQEIGKVTAVALTGPNAFHIDLFVVKPYDALVRPGDVFLNGAPLKLSLSSAGVEARLQGPEAALAGSIELNIPDSALHAAQSPPGAHFLLYPSLAAAAAGPPGPQATYALTFSGAGGDLAPGAPVMLLGYTVGEVKSRRLLVDTAGLPATAVVAMLDPQKLGAPGVSRDTDPATLRAVSDAAIGRLLARGYRARLVQNPPFVGARAISLERAKGDGPAHLLPGDPPRIPSAAASGDIDDLTKQADAILTKVNRIPIEAIGQDVRGITARLNALVSSPKMSSSLDHLNGTLTQADAMMTEVRPQVGPLVAKLNQAADQATGAAAAARGILNGEGADPDASLASAVRELTDTARSIRALADQLGRHPESLVRGKAKEAR